MPQQHEASGVAQLRRQLGPLAWCALECLSERARGHGGPVVEASVRVLAADLGVAKNTAHRAITALVNAGLISPVQDRATDGRFVTGHYVLHRQDLVAPSSRKAARRRPTGRDDAQLSLLGPD